MSVARALGDLPELESALATGELPFSAIKELSRVATRGTEAAWRAAAHGKNLRDIEQLVAGHKPGDLPTDAPDDEARLHTLRLDDISASTYARFRQARQALDRARGSRLSDDELAHALATAILDGASSSSNADHGRAKHQIHYTVCQHCERAWQDGGGARVRIESSAIDQAKCDAIEVPRAIDGKPQRAAQTIPPATRRHIFQRDEARCQTPGCRSSLGLEIHHIVSRADGGTHDPSNLTLRCDACHTAHHVGRLSISGTAPNNLTTVRTPTIGNATVHHRSSSVAVGGSRTTSRPGAHVGADLGSRVDGPSRLDRAIARTNAIAALTSSGYKRHIATAAVDEASAHVGAEAPLEVLLREAFRRCPTRTG
jgi:hypothetical protein